MIIEFSMLLKALKYFIAEVAQQSHQATRGHEFAIFKDNLDL